MTESRTQDEMRRRATKPDDLTSAASRWKRKNDMSEQMSPSAVLKKSRYGHHHVGPQLDLFFFYLISSVLFCFVLAKNQKSASSRKRNKKVKKERKGTSLTYVLDTFLHLPRPVHLPPSPPLRTSQKRALTGSRAEARTKMPFLP